MGNFSPICGRGLREPEAEGLFLEGARSMSTEKHMFDVSIVFILCRVTEKEGHDLMHKLGCPLVELSVADSPDGVNQVSNQVL